MNRHLRLASGIAIWLAACLLLKLSLEAAILNFAPLVLVPLGLRIVETADATTWERTLLKSVSWLQLPGAALLAASFALPQGTWAAALAIPWLVVTGLLALAGSLRLWRRGRRVDGELGIAAALLFVVVGGGWAVISRAGLRPQDFSHEIVLLTGVHFHYAGFVLPLLAGLAVNEARGGGSTRPGWLDRAMLLGIVAGVPAVGVGISLSPHVEVVAAIVLATSCAAFAARQVQVAWHVGEPTRLMLSAVSSLALVSAMALAGVYAVGEFTGERWLAIPTMIRTHGAFNAFGFAACGLAARMWSARSASGRRWMLNDARGAAK
jgi:hypothetical protein